MNVTRENLWCGCWLVRFQWAVAYGRNVVILNTALLSGSSTLREKGKMKVISAGGFLM